MTQSVGSGSVTILRNRIQGNKAGSGDGGGILLRRINGQDVLASNNRNNWHWIQIVNNLIVNNVAGYRAGGVAMQDALRVAIVNNTIANNDSTATAAGAINPDLNGSTAQVAGLLLQAPSLELTTGLSNQQLNAVRAAASNPQLVNDIILGNRSFVWTTTTPTGVGGSTPGQGGGSLSAATNPFWDLRVEGAGGPNLAVNPQYSVLTDIASNSGYAADQPPRGRQPRGRTAVMVNPYWNRSPNNPSDLVRWHHPGCGVHDAAGVGRSD